MKPSQLAALLRPRRPRPPGPTGRLSRCVTIADLRSRARRRLPQAVFDYLDGGAEDEVTLRRNLSAFDGIELVARSLRDVGEVDLRTRVLGSASSLPLVLAPTGFTRMFHPEGELAVARAAGRAGVPYTLSTMGTTSIEDVAAAAHGPLWFQLYVWRDRGLCRELVERAKAAGYTALVLTVDVPVPGARERDLRNGLTIPPRLGAGTLLDGVRHPTWSAGLLRGEPLRFANVADLAAEPTAVMEYVAGQFDPSVTWDDVAEIGRAWGGPFVLKGITSDDDARRAVDVGADAVVVSNHGGRQLDHLPATIDVLPEIVAAAGSELEVLVDSGFRRGSDVVKALALGARAVLVGRPYLYGLATAGQAGVEHAVGTLAAEMRRTLALMGVSRVADLDGSALRTPRAVTDG